MGREKLKKELQAQIKKECEEKASLLDKVAELEKDKELFQKKKEEFKNKCEIKFNAALEKETERIISENHEQNNKNNKLILDAVREDAANKAEEEMKSLKKLHQNQMNELQSRLIKVETEKADLSKEFQKIHENIKDIGFLTPVRHTISTRSNTAEEEWDSSTLKSEDKKKVTAVVSELVETKKYQEENDTTQVSKEQKDEKPNQPMSQKREDANHKIPEEIFYNCDPQVYDLMKFMAFAEREPVVQMDPLPQGIIDQLKNL